MSCCNYVFAGIMNYNCDPNYQEWKTFQMTFLKQCISAGGKKKWASRMAEVSFRSTVTIYKYFNCDIMLPLDVYLRLKKEYLPHGI